MTSLRFGLLVIAVMSPVFALAQDPDLDSLNLTFLSEKNDTMRLVQAGTIARLYKETNPDSAFRYAELMLALAQKMELRLEEASALGEMGYSLTNRSNYPRSLQMLLQAIAIVEDPASEQNILSFKVPRNDEYIEREKPARLQRLALLSKVLQYAAILYDNSMNYKKGLYYGKQSVSLAEESTNMPLRIITQITLGRTYMFLNLPDSALICFEKGYNYTQVSNDKRYLGSLLLNAGRVYLSLKKPETAKVYFKNALVESNSNNYIRGVVASDLELADLYKVSGKSDSSLYHIRHAVLVANSLNAPDLLLRCYSALVDIYKKNNADSTVKYQSLIIQINKETFNAKQVQQFQNIDFNEQQRLNEIEGTKKEFQAQLRTNILLGSTFTLVIIACFLYRNSRTRQKAKQNIEKAYEQLKATQSQLIQSEKMASLGELTAGIAHEIQNPLNFVNNFSEVSNELLDEMKAELASGKDQAATKLANDVKENLAKILHHGKRADSIVKGMLQHSRASSGQKELTDINLLADEYLRLAFHGLRAKDKSFNASYKTDFDASIGKINILPQDIGRVILNLLTNAFYAVGEKKKTASKDYEPTVTVSSKKVGAKAEIRISDNGNGIPQKVLDKIFQPFFTTKPTGQGTGLGLSLSYDIVTKGHGGELKVNTTEGKGSEFTIVLPT